MRTTNPCSCHWSIHANVIDFNFFFLKKNSQFILPKIQPTQNVTRLGAEHPRLLFCSPTKLFQCRQILALCVRVNWRMSRRMTGVLVYVDTVLFFWITRDDLPCFCSIGSSGPPICLFGLSANLVSFIKSRIFISTLLWNPSNYPSLLFRTNWHLGRDSLDSRPLPSWYDEAKVE